MKKMLERIPTEREISLLLDEGYEVEVWMEGEEFVIETNELP